MPINGITTVVRLGARGPSGTVLAAATLTDHETRLDTLEASPTFTGSIAAVSGTFTGNVTAGDSASDALTYRRLVAAGNPPALAAGAAMGSSPGAQTIVGSDTDGYIIQNTGTSATTGILWTVTFAAAKAATTYRPRVLPMGSNAASVELYPQNKTVNGFEIACKVAPTSSTQIAVSWFVTESP